MVEDPWLLRKSNVIQYSKPTRSLEIALALNEKEM
jgi:hypothetical protein